MQDQNREVMMRTGSQATRKLSVYGEVILSEAARRDSPASSPRGKKHPYPHQLALSPGINAGWELLTEGRRTLSLSLLNHNKETEQINKNALLLGG